MPLEHETECLCLSRSVVERAWVDIRVDERRKVIAEVVAALRQDAYADRMHPADFVEREFGEGK